jgi:hypothetical protein
MPLMLAGTLSWAHAAELPLKGTFSGTYVNTQSDTNHDGQKASLGNIGTQGTFGPGTAQAVAEYAFSSPGPCPDGSAGFLFPLVPGTGHGIQRIDSTGDLIVAEFIAGVICFDPTTELQFFTVEGRFTGGTGRFAGATGAATITGTAKTLFEDAAGNFFGEQHGTVEGTLILPAGPNQDHPKGRN